MVQVDAEFSNLYRKFARFITFEEENKECKKSMGQIT